MDLNASKPDEVVMLSVNEQRGAGGKEAWADGLQGYVGTTCSSGSSVAAASALPGQAAEGSVYEVQSESVPVLPAAPSKLLS